MPTCRTCRADLVLDELPRVEAVHAGVVVHLSPLPTLACPAGHERRLPSTEWGLDLTDALQQVFPSSRAGSLIERGERCQRCRAGVDKVELRRETVAVAFDLPAVPGAVGPASTARPGRLEVESERVTCPRCSLDQALGRGGDVPWRALRAAFAAAGIGTAGAGA